MVMAIAVVLFCFYLYVKRKRASSNVSIPTIQDGNTSSDFHTVSPSGSRADEHQLCDRFPPRYSTVDHPPPYSLVCEPCYSGNKNKKIKNVYLSVTSTFYNGFSNYLYKTSQCLIMQIKTVPLSQQHYIYTFSFIFSSQYRTGIFNLKKKAS